MGDVHAVKDNNMLYSRRWECCLIASSAIIFQVVSIVVVRLLTPKTVKDRWKWKNIFVSFLHSSVSGTTAVSCFYLDPHMAEDVINSNTWLSLYLVCMTLGYFIYDTIDLFRFTSVGESWELLLHHAVVVMSMCVGLITHQYLCYLTMGLLTEVNSIFLHLRQLLSMYGNKHGSVYRLNSLLNLGTFIAFRIATLAWMTRWLILSRDLIPLLVYSVTSIGMAILTVMNIILFCRLLYSDFIRQRRSTMAQKIPAKMPTKLD